MQQNFCLKGGYVLNAEGGCERTDLYVADGHIVETRLSDCEEIDCRGYKILPGIVDVHGDAFELELHPRPGVDIPFPIAMRSVDRQLLANGITTVTISWEPGARSLDAGRTFMAGLAQLQPCLNANHRVQLRWETFAHHAIDDISTWLSQSPTPAIAFNDHTTATIEMITAGEQHKLNKWAQRAGVTLEQYINAVDVVSAHAPRVLEKVVQVASAATKHGAVMLSHDEKQISDRTQNRQLGLAVCEFPLHHSVAADAVANNEHVVMGAPNVIRGGSHTGAMSAEEAIREGVCTVMASDYYYPAMLHAAEHLVRRGVKNLAGAWDLVSANPASSMRLNDRGSLAVGNIADIVVLDDADHWHLVHTFANGVKTQLAAR